MPSFASQLRTIFAVISAPLSERMCSGTPRSSIASAIVSMTPKAVNATSHSDCQAFPGELVNQGHEPELSTIVGLRLNEVVAPEHDCDAAVAVECRNRR